MFYRVRAIIHLAQYPLLDRDISKQSSIHWLLGLVQGVMGDGQSPLLSVPQWSTYY